MQQIAGWESAYQEELNRGFARLSEGSFKGLRRQLPITRQKVEWEKVGGYRVCFLPSNPRSIRFALSSHHPEFLKVGKSMIMS